MAKAKHDYDSPEWYTEIALLAQKGYTDAEIADSLDLAENAFNDMKNGNYYSWSKELNERRSKLIIGVLARARRSMVAEMRETYLRAALGKHKTKSVTKSVKRVKVDGEYTGEEIEQTNTGFYDCAPNLQALGTLLYHYDKEWRKIQRNQDDDAEDVPTNINHGIDVQDWIRRELEIGNE